MHANNVRGEGYSLYGEKFEFESWLSQLGIGKSDIYLSGTIHLHGSGQLDVVLSGKIHLHGGVHLFFIRHISIHISHSLVSCQLMRSIVIIPSFYFEGSPTFV